MNRTEGIRVGSALGGSLRDAALERIPTTFGQLIYLTSLREPNTGQYRHYGWAQRSSDGEIDAVLRQLHADAFANWVRMMLEEKKSDLDHYLAGINGDREAILQTWTNLKPYRNLVPASSAEAERNLFFSDLETLIALLQNSYGLGAAS